MALMQRKENDNRQPFTKPRRILNNQNTTNQTVTTHPTADSRQPRHSGRDQPTEYGIGDLVKLIHALPQNNFDAEISAVVRTLASFDINIQNLIADIHNQETLARKRMKVLELEIQLYKAKIKNRQKEMDLLQIGAHELSKSKSFLEQGLKRVGEETNAFSHRSSKKRAMQLKNTPQNDLPIPEKIKLVASQEIAQIKKQGKIKSLRNKFKNRFVRR